MTLSQFNIIELSTASATILGAIAMLLAQTQKSKCKKCKMCCGCVECDRELNTEEGTGDIENQLENAEDETKSEESPKVISPKVPKIPNMNLPKKLNST